MSDITAWLLDSDVALRWQVERDVLHLPEDTWTTTRARVSHEGFGARLLALQDDDGQWAGGAFFPAGFDFAEVSKVGQPWTATTWTLNALREWGVDAAALGDTANRLAANSRWEYDDLPYWDGEVDCCINSWTLSNGLWLGADVDGLVDWFIEHQLDDGGWNCEWVDGATVSSFHSTLNSLKGLLDYSRLTGDDDRVADARRRGDEYLLRRDLFRRLSTGESVGDFAFHLGHPWLWRYNILNAADHFRAAAVHLGTPPDPRMGEAIELIRLRREPDGRWIQGGRPAGDMWFETDVAAGEPSKWLTFLAVRTLDWWDAAQPHR